MHRNVTAIRLMIVTAGIAALVWLSSESLPPIVASHSNGSGQADAMVPHAYYVRFMVAFIVGIPLLPGLLPMALLRFPRMSINLP